MPTLFKLWCIKTIPSIVGVQTPANNGKKLVGQPSISQESKNIQLQVKIPQVTDSWDIPGTPILGKKSPQNQTGPKINISLSIQINLKNSDIDYQNEPPWKRLDLNAIKKGLQIMAEKYPRHMGDFLNENDDADTGDVFLQCCLFGEAIYG